jgi:hypothetical protein
MGASDHSVSNHQRVDRGPPGCQRVYPRLDRLRLLPADSPIHADRIEFTSAAPPGPPVLRTGRSRSVALHPASLRRSYGSIPHGSSPHRSGLPPLYPLALSGALARATGPARPATRRNGQERSSGSSDQSVGLPSGSSDRRVADRNGRVANCVRHSAGCEEFARWAWGIGWDLGGQFFWRAKLRRLTGQSFALAGFAFHDPSRLVQDFLRRATRCRSRSNPCSNSSKLATPSR